MQFHRFTHVLLLLALAAVATGCAGYNIGNQYLHRNDIRTVHVGMFDTESFRPFLGQRLTEAVIKEIELNTPFTITEPALADSFVQGRLIRERKRVNTENRSDEPRNIKLDWRLEVTWVDRAGTPLMQRQLLRVNQDEDFVPEGGQSRATAQQELINRIARQIIGQMEMPW